MESIARIAWLAGNGRRRQRDGRTQQDSVVLADAAYFQRVDRSAVQLIRRGQFPGEKSIVGIFCNGGAAGGGGGGRRFQ